MLAISTPLYSSPAAPLASGRLTIHWAQHLDELREAQRLRHQVFSQELGALLRPPRGTPAGHDADLYDEHCEHLLLRAESPTGEPGPVVACYRVLTADAARRIGGFYADSAFDLIRLRHERHRIAELGRACVAPAYRRGAAVLMLWGAIAEHLQRRRLDLLIGCASVDARHGAQNAWALWNQLAPRHLAPIEWQVRPRTPLHLAPAASSVEMPPLLRGYLKANAQLLGAPAWDPDFRCADFPLMLRLADLPANYHRRFLGGTAAS
ncbi:GNAT family N-acetyltransferase [Inhella gelatinilytica]|uniref:L-ornithine N(alpha)-acyltransferase n=1 Tax=Inhella gelatinilytica TaxID=2795030 RepID=A0A931NDJ3_9BURK|nr:GNAT family N-acyltransferase [Inhella gelatinilytica]MBH9551511.1 GNAT family N-acetyltransferase [Inhella gelatinilytica]